MADNILPEERLFKVIQDQKKSGPTAEDFRKKKKIIDLRLVKQFFANLKSKTPGRQGIQKITPIAISIKLRELDIPAINNILIIVLVFLTIGVIYYTAAKRPDIAKISKALSAIQAEELKRKGAIESFSPIAFYLEQIKKRNVFMPVSKEEIAARSPKTVQAMLKIKERVSDLKLKGIAWGKFPKAIIKNEKEDKIYFLEQGQMVGTTGIEVKSIRKYKVIIGYGEEEIELL